MNRTKKIILALTFFFTSFLFAEELITDAQAVKLSFKYNKDDKYRILSTVEEDVYVNHKLNHHSIILNRVTAEITDVKNDGSGIHNCTFMTTEDSTGSITGAKFNYGEEYQSIFSRSKLGIYNISDEYFMPTVRDVPVFPDKEIKPGDKWTNTGHEAHDLRNQFDLQKPYIVPFTAEYTYLGIQKSTGLHVLNVSYTLLMKTPVKNNSKYSEYPITTKGFSDEIIYWDNERGAIDHYTEKFNIFIETSMGNIYEFTGNAKAEITEFERTNTEENLENVQNKIDDLGLENVTVRNGDKGLTIAIEDIKFQADSAILLDSEKAKLEKIAEILKTWPNNDILISGHTALAGTEKMRQILSEQRAMAVTEYLISLNVRDRFHIFSQGFGATKPISTNKTEEGKAKNRRVEITIMDR